MDEFCSLGGGQIMGTLLVCGRWRLKTRGRSLEETIELGGKREIEHETRITHLSNNAWAFHLLTQKIPKPRTVIDYGAGIGLWGTVVVQELCPKKLTLVDLDTSCAAHLKKAFEDYPNVEIRNTSYYEVVEGPAPDLSCWDLTVSTALRVLGAKSKVPILQALSKGPKALILSDGAGLKLHMNKASYSKLFQGEPINTYQEYLTLFSSMLFKQTGYSITHAVKCGKGTRPPAAYLLLQKGKSEMEYIPIGSGKSSYMLNQGLFSDDQ